MPYIPFYEHFPELAEEETRCLMAFNDSKLPVDNYDLIELYCDEPGCDCRRVFLNIISEKTGKTLAVIAYGWEDEKYYSKWMGDNEPEIIKELKGPTLNLSSPQSKLAPILLDRVKSIVLQDKNYIQRLKRHYNIFREVIEKKALGKQNLKNTNKNDNIILKSSEKIGRNDPCHCGSGKKYKKCCLNKT